MQIRAVGQAKMQVVSGFQLSLTCLEEVHLVGLFFSEML